MIMVNGKNFERWTDAVHEEINVLSEACENMVIAVSHLSETCVELEERIERLEKKDV